MKLFMTLIGRFTGFSSIRHQPLGILCSIGVLSILWSILLNYVVIRLTTSVLACREATS